MKKLLLLLLCLPIIGSAQTVPFGCTGDCENGYGMYVWDNFDTYQGGWENGKMNGVGRISILY